MSPEQTNQVLESAKSIITDLAVGSRITFPLLIDKISTDTGVESRLIMPALRAYIKSRHDLNVKAGRVGGIYKIEK